VPDAHVGRPDGRLCVRIEEGKCERCSERLRDRGDSKARVSLAAGRDDLVAAGGTDPDRERRNLPALGGSLAACA
jgi:hypothetical protein